MISFRIPLNPANSSLQILLSYKQIITNSGRNCSDENIYMEFRFNPIQDGLFRGCSRMGEDLFGPPSLKSVTQILQ